MSERLFANLIFTVSAIVPYLALKGTEDAPPFALLLAVLLLVWLNWILIVILQPLLLKVQGLLKRR